MYRKRKLRWLLFLAPVLMLFIVSAIVMALWNALLPQLFQLPVISFWQAMGLLVLSKILFGGIGNGLHKRRCNRFGRRGMHRSTENFSDR